MNVLSMHLGKRSYDIVISHNVLSQAHRYFHLDRRVWILTDSGVPKEYAQAIAAQCESAKIYTVPQGEASKSMQTLQEVLTEMMEFGMTRTDALVAVGGGVVGDLGGFAAATYMRGIDFYQVPTTLLAQVDSSIGGKCAVNLGSTKNIVGAFYQPKGVLIDTATLSTLPKRLIAAGLAESVKMALTSDEQLFSLLEHPQPIEQKLQTVIERSLQVKKSVVEQDETESGLRKILNFGHTLGHGIEANRDGLYHGECVALGMLPVCADSVRQRLLSVLQSLGLPTKYDGDLQKALDFVSHDKKCNHGLLDVITVQQIGQYTIQAMSIDAFRAMVTERMAHI